PEPQARTPARRSASVPGQQPCPTTRHAWYAYGLKLVRHIRQVPDTTANALYYFGFSTCPVTPPYSNAPAKPSLAASTPPCAPSVPLGERRASSNAHKAPTSGTPTIPDTSTTSARGAPPFLVTPTPKSYVSFKKPPLAGSHSARLPKAKSKSPRPWQHGSHPSKKYGSSARAQKPPCPPSAWPGALPAGPRSSNSKAAITAMPTAFSSRPVPACLPSATPLPPAFPANSSSTPWSWISTASTLLKPHSTNLATRSPASSSNPLPET